MLLQFPDREEEEEEEEVLHPDDDAKGLHLQEQHGPTVSRPFLDSGNKNEC